MKNSGVAGDSCPTRASLLCRLKDWGDEAGWQEFFDTYWRLIYGTAIKAGLNDAEAQDVVQETVLSVAKAMPKFHYEPQRGSFKSWLCNTTHWRIKDHFRKKLRSPAMESVKDDDSRTPVIERTPDPASLEFLAIWQKDWDQNLMEAALDLVKRKVKPKQYQLFDCFVLKGWPMHEITQKLSVSMGQVYFAKVKVSSMVQREFRQLQLKWK